LYNAQRINPDVLDTKLVQYKDGMLECPRQYIEWDFGLALD
jgi:hypothetical protein